MPRRAKQGPLLEPPRGPFHPLHAGAVLPRGSGLGPGRSGVRGAERGRGPGPGLGSPVPARAVDLGSEAAAADPGLSVGLVRASPAVQPAPQRWAPPKPHFPDGEPGTPGRPGTPVVWTTPGYSRPSACVFPPCPPGLSQGDERKTARAGAEGGTRELVSKVRESASSPGLRDAAGRAPT